MIESLADRIQQRIRRSGPLPFDAFVEMALYDGEQGFYAVHGQAGRRRGDFVTSVEVGPLFALQPLVARLGGQVKTGPLDQGLYLVLHDEEAVLGANVVITASTKIIDVTGSEPVETKGYVPPRSVVIPGTRTKEWRKVKNR